ncbi:cell division protein FtsA [Candidatus Mycosynbacter amalyticus]|uniref:Cell division protein FtsA n=1 Tax=Candidatus Mycosynbacter amalyticus TaxID=2665156 RepID=A0A857MMI4_9BACT|nr:cell division protein FtsA [Candidatus Mycosynbacter amalyticus]QHN42489.1 cell division protein FtsA [Candidatus Mycosynbacter amalyticus]
MQDTSKYAVGIDIGTNKIRCVVGHVDVSTGAPTVVGVGEVSNSGMRKGVVVNLAGPSKAIDDALGEAERMSGYQVNAATLSINGSHILSTKADGMIAIGMAGQEVTEADIIRLEDVATTGKVPANREILELVPFSYRLDGQDGIKDPVGMTGTRLEINANVVSALAPHVVNLQKTAEQAQVVPHALIPSAVAASRAVLTEQQLENGVAVIDFGGATTSIAIYEEGDLQYTAVIPVGSNNITNDLAIGLKTDPEVAELVKLQHVTAVSGRDSKKVSVKYEKETHEFATSEIDEIVEARLEELFEDINAELKKAGRKGKLPNGVVLVGGGAQLKGLVDYTKQSLELAARIGKPKGFGGVAEQLESPAFATAVGLMFSDMENVENPSLHKSSDKTHRAKQGVSQAKGFVSKFLDRFRA